MEILPSVRTQCSRTPPFYNPLCFVNTSRNSVFFNGEANPISLNTSCFHQSKGRKLVLSSSYDEGAAAVAHQGLDNSPLSVELEPISGESQFDRVLADAQQLDECVVVLWMASWCRKCIYLKPKLQKLAADYYPSVKFYSVDVNNVPHKLVVRAEVTKMPTIQLWRGGEKRGEVIGGHKAYLVVNEVREIIENETSL